MRGRRQREKARRQVLNYADTIFYQRLVKAIQARGDTVAADTVLGVDTWEAYQRNVGYVAGLQEALVIVNILKEEMSKE